MTARSIFLTPRGRRLTQQDVCRYAGGPGVMLLCGRYEGVDQRVIEARGMEEVSIGDYVLSGGELAALVLLDASVRLLPGVMGAAESAVRGVLLAITCSNTRTTPARPNGRGGASPMSCSRATMPRSPPGARPRPNA